MADASKTFGDFFNALRKTDSIEGQIWMDEWKERGDEIIFQEATAGQLTEDLIVCFAEDMVTLFQQRMQSICTDALYASTSEAGHAFLKELHRVAQQFGVDVSDTINVPITPTEAVTRKKVSNYYHQDPGVNEALDHLLASLKVLKGRSGRTATVILIPHAADEPLFIAQEDGPISNRNPPERVLAMAMAKRKDG